MLKPNELSLSLLVALFAPAIATFSCSGGVPTLTPPRANGESYYEKAVLPEPLVQGSTAPSASEAAAIENLLDQTSHARDPEAQLAALREHINAWPASSFRLPLLVNTGVLSFRVGRFTEAMALFKQAYEEGREETAPARKALVDRALGEYALMLARVGRREELQALLVTVSKRTLIGPGAGLFDSAREGLEQMKTTPESAFRCGPFAVEAVRAHFGIASARPVSQELQMPSTAHGTNVEQLLAYGQRIGLPLVALYRSPGTPVPVPAVVHWKVGHFAALTRVLGGEGYLSEDPTFQEDILVTTAALDAETTGFVLLPRDSVPSPLPPGLRLATPEEMRSTWGKGAISNVDKRSTRRYDRKGGGSCNRAPGMATYSFHLLLASLSVEDTPLTYAPVVGPMVDFSIAYNAREAGQPANFNFANFGPKWTWGLHGYIAESRLGSAVKAEVFLPGGGSESFRQNTSAPLTFYPHFQSSAALVPSADGYERRLPDGSKLVFEKVIDQGGGARLLFLSQVIDRQGNALSLTYETDSLRLTSVTDATGKSTTFGYERVGNTFRINRIADPYGRQALFAYDEEGRLASITDAIGIASQFGYEGAGDFLSTLTTPYGVTTFTSGSFVPTALGANVDRFVQATDAEGKRERVEFRNSVCSSQGSPCYDPNYLAAVFGTQSPLPAGILVRPSQTLYYRNAYFWDKAMLQTIGEPDISKARIFHFIHGRGLNDAVGLLEASKEPLEGWVWYNYQGVTDATNIEETQRGLLSKVGRIVQGGATQLRDYAYNDVGNLTSVTLPAGDAQGGHRYQTDFVYAENGIDLVEVRQRTSGINELLATFSYNATSKRLPATYTDAAGATYQMRYTGDGRLREIQDPRGGRTTYTFDATTKHLASIARPAITGNDGKLARPVWRFTYDAFGRVNTITDEDDYQVTLDYDQVDGDPRKTLDRIAKVTFPDGTATEYIYDRLDLAAQKDRRGRWVHYRYDLHRRLVKTIEVMDPSKPLDDAAVQRVTQMTYCECDRPETLTDAGGNVTTWTYDLQGRLTEKLYAAVEGVARKETFTYDAASGRRTRVEDAKGQSRSYSYLPNDALSRVDFSPADPSPITYEYDPHYDRLASATQDGRTTFISYHPVDGSLGAGHMKSIDGIWGRDSVSFEYDILGRTNRRRINGNLPNVSDLRLDGIGRVVEHKNVLGAFRYEYEGLSARVKTMRYPTDAGWDLAPVSFEYYDNVGDRLLKRIVHARQSDGAVSGDYSYKWDAEGRLTEMVNLVAAPLQNGGLQYRALFSRDAVDRLLGSSITHLNDNFDPSTSSYVYDLSGNRTSTTTPEKGTVTATPNALNQIVSTKVGNEPPAALTYDENGNLTNDGRGRTFVWNAADQLVTIRKNVGKTITRTDISYDAFGRWVRFVERAGWTLSAPKTDEKRFVWCGTELCEERDANNQVRQQFFPQGVAGFLDDGSGMGKWYYERDHLGSVRALNGYTAAIYERLEYDDFGRRSTMAWNPGLKTSSVGFTGHYYHAPSGLYLTPYRPYDPELGRFLSRDPSGEGGGINLYAYASNAPIDFTDPLGLTPQSAAQGAVVGGVIGGGIGGLAGAAGGSVVLPGFGTISGAAGVGSVGAGIGAVGGAVIGDVLGNIAKGLEDLLRSREPAMEPAAQGRFCSAIDGYNRGKNQRDIERKIAENWTEHMKKYPDDVEMGKLKPPGAHDPRTKGTKDTDIKWQDGGQGSKSPQE